MGGDGHIYVFDRRRVPDFLKPWFQRLIQQHHVNVTFQGINPNIIEYIEDGHHQDVIDIIKNQDLNGDIIYFYVDNIGTELKETFQEHNVDFVHLHKKGILTDDMIRQIRDAPSTNSGLGSSIMFPSEEEMNEAKALKKDDPSYIPDWCVPIFELLKIGVIKAFEVWT
jgi:hypothetical protein